MLCPSGSPLSHLRHRKLCIKDRPSKKTVNTMQLITELAQRKMCKKTPEPRQAEKLERLFQQPSREGLKSSWIRLARRHRGPCRSAAPRPADHLALFAWNTPSRRGQAAGSTSAREVRRAAQRQRAKAPASKLPSKAGYQQSQLPTADSRRKGKPQAAGLLSREQLQNAEEATGRATPARTSNPHTTKVWDVLPSLTPSQPTTWLGEAKQVEKLKQQSGALSLLPPR